MREELYDQQVLAMYDVRGIQNYILKVMRQKRALVHLCWWRPLLQMD